MARPKGIPAWNKGLKGVYKASEATRKKLSVLRKGKKRAPFTIEWRKNMSLVRLGKHYSPATEFKKGMVSWVKGKKLTEEHKRKAVDSRRKNGSYVKGDKAQGWKGEEVGYRNLHRWVERERGTPDRCEFCGTSGLKGKQIDWANKSREYKRDSTDWLRLCKKCHVKYDRAYA